MKCHLLLSFTNTWAASLLLGTYYFFTTLLGHYFTLGKHYFTLLTLGPLLSLGLVLLLYNATYPLFTWYFGTFFLW